MIIRSPARQKLNELVNKVNNSLPTGITVNISKHGTISYRVRTSKTICGVVNRVSLGTFPTAESAIKALMEFKITGAISVAMPAVNELMQSSPALLRSIEDSEVEAVENMMLANAEKQFAGQQAGAASHLNTFKFLQTVPFHELDPERNYNYSDPDSGEPKTIPKDVIVKFLAWLETDEADSERSDSGTSAAAQSDVEHHSTIRGN